MQQEKSEAQPLPTDVTSPEAAGGQASPDTVGQASEPSPEVDTMPNLSEALRAAELKAEEHHDAWLRAKAETENVRRRAADDVAKAHKFAGEKFAQAMLPVKDSLEAALAADNATLESLREGVELTLRQLESAFGGARWSCFARFGSARKIRSTRDSTRTCTRPSARSRPTSSRTP